MIKKPNNFKCFSAIKNQEGAVLVAALLLLVVVAVMCTTLMNWTILETNRAQGYQESKAAFYLAEAGLQQALDGMNYDAAGNPTGWATNGFNDELTGGLGLTDVDVAGRGTFTATITDNNDDGNLNIDVDNAVLLTSTGNVDGITASVRAMIFLVNAPPTSTNALTTNGNMTISGNPIITGACGSAHSNGNFDATGTPKVVGGITASGTYSGTPTGSGGKPHIDIPDLTPSDFRGDADYELRSDGSVWSGGSMIYADATSVAWNGWKYDGSGKWDLGGSNTVDGMLYIQGDAVVGGSPGSIGNPWDVSIVATGNIEIAGNPTMTNYMDPGDSEGVQNIFMLAGEDLKYNGNASTTITGLLYAKENIGISGNPDIVGSVMSYWTEGDPQVSGVLSENNVSGNPTITYDCGMEIPGPPTASVTVATWNQL